MLAKRGVVLSLAALANAEQAVEEQKYTATAAVEEVKAAEQQVAQAKELAATEATEAKQAAAKTAESALETAKDNVAGAEETIKQALRLNEIPSADAEQTLDEEQPQSGGGILRWGWWLVIAYMFYAQATICDEYFVQSIKVVVETFGIPEDVAGATLMALGCNGPELFTNFIAIFITHNDVGVGTIVGSEIFNLLCIVGGSIVACPVLPLEIEKAPFVRDCAFYALSIVLLAWALQDSVIVLHEAVTLLVMCAVYAICVTLTKPFMDKFFPKAPRSPAGRKSLRATVGPEAVTKEQLRMSLAPDEAEIKIIQPNRLEHNLDAREAVSFNVLPEGLEVIGDMEAHPAFQAPLLSKTETKKIIRFEDVVMLEETKEKDLPICLHCDDEVLDFMEVQIYFKDPAYQRKVLDAIKKNMPAKGKVVFQSEIKPGEIAMTEMKNADTITKKILHAICLPLELCLEYTMGWCDVKVPVHEHKWAECFCMSMVWLAIFSYLMCSVADIIHQEFGISTALLGITLCAVGTSFPNFYASLIMAGENRSAMAIANALGSNIQNVFLALAVPWTLKCLVSETYDVSANGIGVGVAWMGFTLVVLVGMVGYYSFKMEKWMGWVLVVLYFVYLVQTIFF
ncbi:unnamed protein product [Amoebophrya sp. A120]|nr:unnamed protein product [Amoebophrya sp. A120]|eukprot:GSA120T00012853001.1